MEAKKLENILKKIKENYLYILLPIVFISFLLINLNVVYFGDDYYYLTFRNLNFTDYFSTLAEHYCTANGRFIVHMFATIFLKLPIQFWQVLNSLMLTGICFFLAKVVCGKNKKTVPLIFSIAFLFIAVLDISITRQSTYWITGSFNYIYPTLLLLIYWYLLKNIERKKFFAASIFVGILAAATVEQAGIMVFGLTLLTFLSKVNFVKKNFFKEFKTAFKSNSRLLILIFATLIGVLTVVLAPSQFVRISEETTETPFINTFLSNAKFILVNYTMSKNILPYALFFNLFAFIYAYKNIKDKKSKYIVFVASIINFALNLINAFTCNYGTVTIMNIALSAIILLTYLIDFIIINKHLFNKLFSELTITTILMVGSQLMMLVSPVFGPRNLIFGLIMFVLLICILIYNTEIKHTGIISLLIIVAGLMFNFNTYKNYSMTKFIDNKNIEIISESQDKLNDENQDIILYKFIDDNYGWSMPYMSTYHLYYFKQFYNIKCNILWDDYTS